MNTDELAQLQRNQAAAVQAARFSARTRQTRGLTLNLVVVNGALLGLYFYELAFNFIPDGPRLQLAGALSVGLIALSLGSFLLRPHLWRLVAGASILTVVMCWLIGEALGYGRLEMAEIIRFMFPFLFGLWIIEYRRHIHPNVIAGLAGFTIVFALFWVIVHPQEVVNNLLRFPPFTGGDEGAHASAYVVALSGLIIHQLLLSGTINARLGWSLLALTAFLLLGMRVATPIMMLLNYFLLHVLLTRRLNAGQKIIIWAAVVASIVLLLLWHEALQDQVRGQEADVENLGSGRVGTWLGRLEMLSQREAGALAVGTGPGSDSFYSVIWWWEKKDSHNDLLTITIEAGLIGLVAVLFFYVWIFRRMGQDGYPLLWFTLSGSLLSNALIGRPIIATLFWIAAALAAHRSELRYWQRRRSLARQPGALRPRATATHRRQQRHG